jgi:hypothetical protein
MSSAPLGLDCVPLWIASAQRTGDELLDVLADELETYKKPTLSVHGDTHMFRVGRPLLSKKTKRFFENFTRL